MTQVGENTLTARTDCTTCQAAKNGQNLGHSIDVATGRAFIVAKDLSFPSPLRLDLFRTWLSTNKNRPGLFGLGWSTLFDTCVALHPQAITWYDDEYHETEFPAISPGDTADLPSKAMRLVRETDAMEVTDGQGRIFHYALDPGSTTGTLQWISRNGHDLIWLDRYQGRLNAIRDAAGTPWEIGHDKAGRITGIAARLPSQDRTRLIREFRYDARDRLIMVLDELGSQTRYRYNDDNLLIRETDRNGFSFHYEYDRDHRCIRNYGDNGTYLRVFDYYPDENRTVVTDAGNHQTVFYWKHTGLVEMTRDALGHTSQRIHDCHGHLMGEILKNKTIILYENDARGCEFERTDPAGHVWRTDHTDTGIKERDPLGNEILKTYDANGNLIREETPDGQFRIHHHDHLNRPIPRRGNDRQRSYNPWHRLILEQDPRGNQTWFSYDIKGRFASETDAAGRTTQYRYDGEDNCIAILHPQGVRQTFAYQGTRDLASKTDENNHTHTFGYDLKGNLTHITTPLGHTYTLAYDPLNRITRETGFDSQTTRYDYDAMDNLVRIHRADDSSIAIDYDLTGHPVTITATDGADDSQTSTYTWDPAGHLMEAVNRHCRITFTYDALGRVIKESQDDFFIEHHLDNAGNEVHTRNAWSYTTDWDYDANNRPIHLTLPGSRTVRLIRDAAGRPVECHLPGDLISWCTHDPTGKLLTQAVTRTTDTRPEPLINRSYVYDAAGRLMTLASNTWSLAATYDDAGQVEHVYTSHPPFEHYAWDPCCNPAGSICQPGNRLTFHNGIACVHDALGNVVRISTPDRAQDITYTAFNQVQTVREIDGTSATYAYDALGRRISKRTGNGQETRYVWDLFRLAGETNGTETTWYAYYPGSFVPLCCYKNNTAFFYHTDHLGTPLELTDDHGAIVWSARYHTFGRCFEDPDPAVENNLRYPGQYHDRETDLHYNLFRYYYPEIGRYITQNPIRYLSGNYNLYRYCKNNPLNQIDPLGFEEATLTLAAAALVKSAQFVFFVFSAVLAAAGIIKTQQKPKAQDGKCY